MPVVSMGYDCYGSVMPIVKVTEMSREMKEQLEYVYRVFKNRR
jgi:hypothetical protein